MTEPNWQALNQFMAQPSTVEWKEPTQSFRGGIVEVVEDVFNPGCGWIKMRDGTIYRYSVDFPKPSDDTTMSERSDT